LKSNVNQIGKHVILSDGSPLPRSSRILIITFYLVGFFFLSLYISNFTKNTDFPVFYSTAKTVLTKGISNNYIYTIDKDNQYNIPESHTELSFIYSKVSALLLSPLGLLPYYYAKATMIFLNIIAYLSGTFLLLSLLGFSGRSHFYAWGLSFLWPPFIQVLRFGQIDGLLFLFLIFALYLTKKQRLLSAGFMIGLAMLFKLFPLALAMVLAVKSRKILLGCLMVFASSFIIPGAIRWFTAIPDIYPRAFSVIYIFLKSQSFEIYAIYCLLVGGTTALIVFTNKYMDFPHIFAMTLPAIYLTIPIVEYYHLTSLIFPFLFILRKIQSMPVFHKALLILCFLIISICIKDELSIFAFIAIFFVWAFLSLRIVQDTVAKRLSNNPS
jgi:hypothetical protein